MLKLDLHVHSSYSNRHGHLECFNNVEVIRQATKKTGINALSITDHDTLSYNKLKPKLKSLFLLPGVEISTKQGHLLAYGIKEPIKPKLDVFEAVARVREQNGLVIVPHPFSFKGLAFRTAKLKPDAVEIFNSINFSTLDKLSEYYVKNNNLKACSGSDSHFPLTIGATYVEVNCEPKVDEVIEHLRKGRFKIKIIRRAGLIDKLRWAGFALFGAKKLFLREDSLLINHEK